MRRWVIYEGFVSLGNRFGDDARMLGAATWRRWSFWMVVGFGVSAAVMVLLVQISRFLDPRGVGDWDQRWLEWFVASGPMSEHDAIWFQTLGSSAMQLPVVALAACIAVRLRHPLVAASILAIRIGEVPLAMLGWTIYDRPRPVSVEAAVAFATQNGFPSGHTANVICFYGFLLWLWARQAYGWPERILVVFIMFAIIGAVAIARLSQSMHYPTDIIAGAIVGGCWLAFGIHAQKRAEAVAHSRPGLGPGGAGSATGPETRTA